MSENTRATMRRHRKDVNKISRMALGAKESAREQAVEPCTIGPVRWRCAGGKELCYAVVATAFVERDFGERALRRADVIAL